MSRNQTKEIFNDGAQIYFEKYGDLKNYNDSFDFFCEAIKKDKASILEVACGPGNISKYIHSKKPAFKILGTDFAPNMIEIAKRENPQLEFQVLDIKKMNSLSQKFDGIICGFGFPYLSREDVEQFVSNSKEMLNQDGVLYLSTMEDDYSKSGIEYGSTGKGMMMHYHEKDHLLQTLEQNGFSILSCENQKFEEGDYKLNDLIIIASI